MKVDEVKEVRRSATIRSTGIASADREDLRVDIAISERKLSAALQRISRLEEKNVSLVRKLALLSRQMANASQFAYYDELTGLPNRRLLADRFAQALERAKRQCNQVVVLFLDLDGFKQINDEYGHPAGDKLLQSVAARLVACIRSSDTVCRFGGDEFVVLLAEFEGHDGGARTAQKIRSRIAVPFRIDGAELMLTASIGAAVYPDDGDAIDDLIQTSDRAMYRSKAYRSAR